MQPRGMGSFCLPQPGPSWCCTSCHGHPCHKAMNSGLGQGARRGWSPAAALATVSTVSTSPLAWEQQREGELGVQRARGNQGRTRPAPHGLSLTMGNSKQTWVSGSPRAPQTARLPLLPSRAPAHPVVGVVYTHPYKPSCFLRPTGPSLLLSICDHREKVSPNCRTHSWLLILT